MDREIIRLKELYSYHVLDTPPETELDELAEIASLACEVPISLITFIDEDRQWYKAKKGLTNDGVNRKDSFCQHLLYESEEILIVEDTLQDLRFIDNPSVKESPGIRFYVGVPLKTPDQNVLGTLCVVDYAPRSISENQIKILNILSQKIMNYLNTRRTLIEQKNSIDKNSEKLRKLTNNVPCGIIQLKRTIEGELVSEFISEGVQRLYPFISLEEWKASPEIFFKLIHPDDVTKFKNKVMKLFKINSILNFEYRVKIGNEYRWHIFIGNSENNHNGNITLYGIIYDISNRIEYEIAMEQIVFDISHILRRPVTSLLGLNDLIDREKNISKTKLKEYVGYIKKVSEEMDQYTRNLNNIYQEKREMITNSNNIKNRSRT